MSDLPDQEEMISIADMNHIIARKVAAIQMEALSNKVNTMETENHKIFSDIRASLNTLTDSVGNSTHEMYECRQELKNEIDTEYVSDRTFRAENVRLETMISNQWKTITLAVSIVFGMITIGARFI